MAANSLFGKFDVIVWLRRLTLGLLALVTAFAILIWITTKSSMAADALDSDEGMLGAFSELFSALTDSDDPTTAIGALWSLFLMSLLPVAVLAYFAAVPLLCVRLTIAAYSGRRKDHRIAEGAALLLGALAFYLAIGSTRLWIRVLGEESVPTLAGYNAVVAEGLFMVGALMFGVLCACCVRCILYFKDPPNLANVDSPTPERAAIQASLIEQPILPVLVILQCALIGAMILAPAPAFLVILLWLLPCCVLWLLIAVQLPGRTKG